MNTIIVLLYAFGYLHFVVGNYLIDSSQDLLTHHNHGENDMNDYTNLWYFHTIDDLNEIHEVIIQQGFSFAEPVDNVPNVYKVKMKSHPETHPEPFHNVTNILKRHSKVLKEILYEIKTIEEKLQQLYIGVSAHLKFAKDKLEESMDYFFVHFLRTVLHVSNIAKVNWAKQGFTRNLYKRMPTDVHSRYEKYFNDELWNLQWYEQDYRENNNDDMPLLDMNLIPVYEELKYTGRGIRIAIIDDGIEYTHDDLKDNYEKEISINLNWNKMDPMPRYEDPTNIHGTRCAGEIAMAANNGKCGVGIAYNAKVGGIVLLDGETNDEMEARALLNALSLVDIYNGSWGPQDNGKMVDGPGVIAQMALEIGATTGRNGKGAIYVFASGNGRIYFDNCAADGYVGSIYTVVVSSATESGRAPAYAERCAAVVATAYSGGMDENIKIVTSDINNTCTLSHSGTSAAAPLVSGVIALALESNGNLTWRDVQHLLARNCEIAPLLNNEGWSMNAAGFYFNPRFGFGLLNAYRLVREAISWRTVPEKSICAVNFDINKNSKYFGRALKFTTELNTDGCMGRVKYLEHVQLSMTIQYPQRGMIEVDLRSPNNTTCKMMEPRPLDNSNNGFLNWKIKSLQFWGEHPFGKWAVFIKDETSDLYANLTGSVEELQLILHGTEKHPYIF